MYSMLMKPETVIAPAVLDADTAPVAIDLKGFYAASFLIHVGVGGITFTPTNKVEFKLTHSDDDVTYDAVDETDVDYVESVGAGGIVLGLTAAHAAAAAYRLNYVGGRRYVKLLAEFGGTHSGGTPISTVVLKGHPSAASEVL